jgi:hypothetical protein
MEYAELIIKDPQSGVILKRITPPKEFSPDYVTARNELIPFAEATANDVHGDKTTGTEAERERWAAWSRTFHLRMNELA